MSMGHLTPKMSSHIRKGSDSIVNKNSSPLFAENATKQGDR